jgi:metal-responsive CopG/Arc/MetJ family transcriptional regulator
MVMPRRQTLVQLNEELLAVLDRVAASSGRSRSQVIREAIERYLQESVETDVDRVVVEAYTREPQEPDAWVDELARRSIAEERW